jgi:hypothetical protein
VLVIILVSVVTVPLFQRAFCAAELERKAKEAATEEPS